jgi:hypothetical protein
VEVVVGQVWLVGDGLVEGGFDWQAVWQGGASSTAAVGGGRGGMLL